MMPVTIRDVAKHLDLSITTVSRALDGYSDVSEATRQRVRQAARELGYLPNRATRQLRRKRTDTIGYILPSGSARFSDPFFAEFISALADEAAQNSYDLLVSSAPSSGVVEQQVYQRWVCERRVDGFVLNRLRQSDWRLCYLAEEQVPFVTLERSLDVLDSLYSQPPLTTVDQPVPEIAHLLVRMLLAEINRDTLPERHVVIQPILRFRHSTIKGGQA